jgi:transposase-like protein
MMIDRGLFIDHTTIYRWVQHYAPEIKKKSRSLFRPTNDSYRVDEIYIKVKGRWKYLYRAVDSEGDTIDFMLNAKRDQKAAERFFKRALKTEHAWPPRVINVDQNAAYPPAVDNLKAQGVLDENCELRRCKYLNSIIEQDHRNVKRLTRAGLGFKSFSTARRTIDGYETMHMIRKGQVMGIEKRAIKEQAIFIEELFGIAA